MTQVVNAVYEDGILKPLEPLTLAEHEKVRITVEPLDDGTAEKPKEEDAGDPLDGLRVKTGIPDLAEHFDDYRFGRRTP